MPRPNCLDSHAEHFDRLFTVDRSAEISLPAVPSILRGRPAQIQVLAVLAHFGNRPSLRFAQCPQEGQRIFPAANVEEKKSQRSILLETEHFKAHVVADQCRVEFWL